MNATQIPTQIIFIVCNLCGIDLSLLTRVPIWVTYFGNKRSDWSVMMSSVNINTATDDLVDFFRSCATSVSMVKKKRAANLQQEEKELLVELVATKYRNITECKATDVVSVKIKNQTDGWLWQTNSTASHCLGLIGAAINGKLTELCHKAKIVDDSPAVNWFATILTTSVSENQLNIFFTSAVLCMRLLSCTPLLQKWFHQTTA